MGKVWHAPTIHERLMHIERGRAADELDQLENILAMMHYNAFYSINLNARVIALQHRNRQVYTMLDVMAAGGHHNGLMRSNRRGAILFDRNLDCARDDHHRRLEALLLAQRRDADMHARQAELTTRQLNHSLRRHDGARANPYLQAGARPMRDNYLEWPKSATFRRDEGLRL